MRARRLAAGAPALVFLLLGGCSGATIDEAYGRPDATRWTYFEASAEQVVSAIESYYAPSEIRLEASSQEAGGVLLTFASRQGGSTTQLILVQRSPVEGFGARAQLYPRGRPLPRDMEAFVAGRS